MLYTFHIFPMHATCLMHHIPLDLVNSTNYGVPRYAVTSSRLVANNIINTLLSKVISLCLSD